MAEFQQPRIMRAAQIVEYGKPYQLTERPTPIIRDHELLVRVKAAGFCHSDLQVLDGQFKSPLGLIPSHEPAGCIVQIGHRCHPRWKLGQRVGVLNFKNACDQCAGCKIAKQALNHLDPRYCDNRETAGFQHDGAFAEYIVADPETTVLLPDSLSFEQAAPLMCAGATVWGSLERATQGLEQGSVVAVVGIGGLGHLGIQFAKGLGFRTIAVDSRPAGRLLANETSNPALRPDLVIDSGSPDADRRIFEFTEGQGVAAAIVCTDSLIANAWALKILRMGGSLGILGLPAEQWRFEADLIVFKELTLRGTYVASRVATERMMEVVSQYGIESHLAMASFDDIPGIVDAYKDADFRGRLVVRISK
ncbi:hypothetical protein D7B24_003331 [Verticillium nonalfalfae]|uniref:Enoyl reductase (ER) domain-containing protein n=1 Tax=Verticillium nonalfalfae TaxID=1051616 RepID=A0A3M9XWD4_9PEZI|nr:uncharacterized protein D7B24_003331 [Verticillium nonalfalfae]RNJ52553.1 hypothetical protein D7B24_003331 [Verticillium nonalfalfae]